MNLEKNFNQSLYRDNIYQLRNKIRQILIISSYFVANFDKFFYNFVL